MSIKILSRKISTVHITCGVLLKHSVLHTNKLQLSNSLLIEITSLRAVTLQLAIKPPSVTDKKSVRIHKTNFQLLFMGVL